MPLPASELHPANQLLAGLKHDLSRCRRLRRLAGLLDELNLALARLRGLLVAQLTDRAIRALNHSGREDAGLLHDLAGLHRLGREVPHHLLKLRVTLRLERRAHVLESLTHRLGDSLSLSATGWVKVALRQRPEGELVGHPSLCRIAARERVDELLDGALLCLKRLDRIKHAIL